VTVGKPFHYVMKMIQNLRVFLVSKRNKSSLISGGSTAAGELEGNKEKPQGPLAHHGKERESAVSSLSWRHYPPKSPMTLIKEMKLRGGSVRSAEESYEVSVI